MTKFGNWLHLTTCLSVRPTTRTHVLWCWTYVLVGQSAIVFASTGSEATSIAYKQKGLETNNRNNRRIRGEKHYDGSNVDFVSEKVWKRHKDMLRMLEEIEESSSGYRDVFVRCKVWKEIVKIAKEQTNSRSLTTISFFRNWKLREIQEKRCKQNLSYSESRWFWTIHITGALEMTGKKSRTMSAVFLRYDEHGEFCQVKQTRGR